MMCLTAKIVLVHGHYGQCWKLYQKEAKEVDPVSSDNKVWLGYSFYHLDSPTQGAR